MKTHLNYKAEEKKQQEKTEDIDTKLRRLAATCHGHVSPIQDIHRYFFGLRTNPYEGMAPDVAWFQFMQLCKEYKKQCVIGSSVDMLREKSSVSLCPTYVIVNDSSVVSVKDDVKNVIVQEIPKKPVANKTIRIIAGDLKDSLTQDQMMARDVANILTVYTACEEREVSRNGVAVVEPIVKGLTAKQQSDGLLYLMDLEAIRLKYPFVGPSNIETRNLMYADLVADLKSPDPVKVDKQRAIIYMLMDDIAKLTREDYTVPMEAVRVKCFNDFRDKENTKPRDIMRRFDFSKFKLVKCNEHEKTWMTYLKSRQQTGSGKDNIFAGYSWLDTVPGAAKQYEEAMDIVNCARMHGYAAVRLMQANVVLSTILNSSGLSVYCTTYGRSIQGEGDPAAVYYGGPLKVMNWFAIKQKSPEIKGDKVVFPEPAFLPEQDSFIYEYIPKQADGRYIYLPSMKAALGYCIKTNVKATRFTCTVPQLIERFYKAIFTRSQYLYTRVTFPAIDPMYEYFTYAIVLSKTKEGEVDKDNFAEITKVSEALGFNKDEIIKWSENGKQVAPYLQVTEHNSVVKDVPKTGTKKLVSSAVDEMKVLVRTYYKEHGRDKIKELFFRLAKNLDLHDDAFQSTIAPLARGVVLADLAAVGGFSSKQKIHPNGGVGSFDTKYWAQYLKELPSVSPAPVAKDIKPKEEVVDKEIEVKDPLADQIEEPVSFKTPIGE